MSNIDPTDFIYHASTNGQKREFLDAAHSLPFGDWGDGAYLSDDYELSKIWGASSEICEYQASINIYDIDPYINNLNGYIIDPDDDDDLLIWASSIAICRTNRIAKWLQDNGEQTSFINKTIDAIEEAYDIYEVDSFLSQHDWLISRRSDDGLWTFITEFFSNNLSIDGLREVYEVCSFGDQLVLKTDAATDCLEFVQLEMYDTSPYEGTYNDITRQNTSKFRNILNLHRASAINGIELLANNIIWHYDEKGRVENDRMY